jgi:hypothetical protein
MSNADDKEEEQNAARDNTLLARTSAFVNRSRLGCAREVMVGEELAENAAARGGNGENCDWSGHVAVTVEVWLCGRPRCG